MSYLSKTELRATLSLSAILAIRLLGLFMILPVFSLYTDKLPGATPSLIGLALGIYGFTQAIFQMPFGMLSDKIGRKPIIAIGLLIFITGSLIAGFSTHIYAIIWGRALQGAGAIGSTLIAFIADYTRVEHRAKAMALMGMTIGLSFAAAMILGPFFSSWINLAGIFWICAALGILGLLILFLLVPSSPHVTFHRDTEPVPSLFFTIIRSPTLLLLNISICFLHIILTASFIAIPILLTQLGLEHSHLWHFYLVILILSFLVMIPLIATTERKQQFKTTLLSGIVFLGFAELFFWKLPLSFIAAFIALFIFFTAFNLLEACLPSLVSRLVSAKNRGTAMGLFSTFQYLGIFIGGSAGGVLLQFFGLTGVFVFCLVLIVIWLGLMIAKATNLVKSEL